MTKRLIESIEGRVVEQLNWHKPQVGNGSCLKVVRGSGETLTWLYKIVLGVGSDTLALLERMTRDMVFSVKKKVAFQLKSVDIVQWKI